MSPSSAGANSPGHFRHETTSITSATDVRQSTDTQHEQAPVPYCLDLRGSSFQPSALVRSEVDPFAMLTCPPVDPFSGGRMHLPEIHVTGRSNLEQCEVLPVLPFVPVACESLWQPADPTSTYTSLQSSMITEAEAAVASVRNAEEGGTTTHFGSPLMIAEEDDAIVWARDLGSEVRYAIRNVRLFCSVRVSHHFINIIHSFISFSSPRTGKYVEINRSARNKNSFYGER